MKQTANYEAHEQTYQFLKNSGASGWGGDTYSSRMENWDIIIQELLDNSDFPKPPARLLELGSGAGDVTLKFAKFGYTVAGIEISTTAVEWAKEKARNLDLSAHFMQGSVCDLNYFSGNSFDIVVDGNCFHCIIGNDRKKFLSESYRVLNTNGILYIGTMVGDPKQNLHEFDPVTRCQIKNGQPYRYMGQTEDILSELNDSGFKVISKKVTTNTWWDHLSCLARKI